ncbi:MAG: response regulator [Gammaproteobacteria bacterium]|nr:response regulator [Gammaproteobacteria bacterium]
MVIYMWFFGTKWPVIILTNIEGAGHCDLSLKIMFKTLLVEDNLNYRSVLKSALLERFVDLETRESSGDGDTLNTVDSFDPDLIIMDIDLKSGENGLDLTKQIKAGHPETVVFILSQYDIPEYRAVAQQNGADLFLSKSSSLESIFDHVDSIIDHYHDPH